MNHAFGLRQNKPNQTQPVVSLPALSLVEVSKEFRQKTASGQTKTKNSVNPVSIKSLWPRWLIFVFL